MIFALTLLLSIITVAGGFIVYHFSRSHNSARKNSVLLKIAGVILIIGGVLSISLNLYIYDKYRKENKVEELLPFEIADPEK